MKKIKLFLFVFVCVFTLSSCSIKTDGNTLHGFNMRMNEQNPEYSMTDSGYILDETMHTLTKYFIINDHNLMLCFGTDENNNLSSLNIVFDNISEGNTQELEFIKSCIECYCNDKAISDKLLSGTGFPKVLYAINMNTIKNKVGNTEILIDVTDIGCVISVVQNTQ